MYQAVIYMANNFAASIRRSLPLLHPMRAIAGCPGRHSNLTWKPPDEGWVKLNSDGAKSSQGSSACGGVLRDHNGNFICAFACKLGDCPVLDT